MKFVGEWAKRTSHNLHILSSRLIFFSINHDNLWLEFCWISAYKKIITCHKKKWLTDSLRLPVSVISVNVTSGH
jgi:hypothetical protein